MSVSVEGISALLESCQPPEGATSGLVNVIL